MKEPTAKFVNMYNVTTYPNGDVLINSVRQNILGILLYYIGTAVCFYYAFQLESEIRYLLGLIALVGLFACFMLTWSWLKPGSVFICREENYIDIKSKSVNRIVHADEIKNFRFFQTSVHKTMTGDIVGKGPKAYIQAIQLDLKDGSDLLILQLKTGYAGISHDWTEKDDAKELMKIIQGSLRKYVPIND
jgi:hypothetical protein